MIDTTVFQDKKAVYYTLGCKLNFSETSSIGKMLKDVGVRTVRKGEKADICVINTCSVTEIADKKCRQAIHRLTKQHPGAFVCMSALLTTTMIHMEKINQLLKEKHPEVKTFIGGAPVTADFARQIGVDYYSDGPQDLVETLNKLSA